MITVETLVIVLFVIVTLLTMGVWYLIRMYIGEKGAKNIGTELLVAKDKDYKFLRKEWQSLSLHYKSLTREDDRKASVISGLRTERKELDASWEDMNAKLCLAQDRLAVADHDIKEMKHQVAQFRDTARQVKLNYRERGDTIEELKVEHNKLQVLFDEAQQGWAECSEQLDIESLGLASAEENVRVAQRFLEQRDVTIDGLRTHVTALQEEIAGER